MKFVKITAILIAAIAVLAIVGGAIAIKEWVDQYVALSLLTPAPKSAAPIAIRSKGKAMAQKAISITVKESRPDYASMTIRQLKALCKGTGIKGWEKLRKAQLITALYSI